VADIHITDLHKSFGGTPVLQGIKLHIADGELVVFVGPSGCGKSTLLRVVAGLDSASSGQVHIGGRDMTQAPAGQRKLAMVFQSYALYPHMTVADNLSFGMRMRGVPTATVQAKVARAVALLQLQPYLARRPGELSGGQCQRVAIGRAIVQEPGAFLFDEPLSNLDAELRLLMRVEIAALHRELGTTMVYVTHDQVEAMTLAQRIVVLRAGVVEQVGSPLALYHNPANTFVASFIGAPAMNLLPATLAAGQATLADGTVLAIETTTPAVGGLQTTSGHIGIRPEHLVPSTSNETQGFKLQVKAVENLGPHSLCHGTVAGTAFTAELRGALSLRGDNQLWLQPQSGMLQVFDSTGRNIGHAKAVPSAHITNLRPTRAIS
jgi:ABC-type sugar transport system ATPase subunit